MRQLALSAVLLASLSACDRLTPPPAHEQAKTPQPAAGPAAAPAEPPSDSAEKSSKSLGRIEPGEIPEVKERFPAPERLVAIGDVHGDYEATRRALRLAGATDENDRWIGGELVIVQTG